MYQASSNQNWFVSIASQRSAQVATVAWAVALVIAFALTGPTVPFNRPLIAGMHKVQEIGTMFGTVLVLPFIYMAVTYFLTRRRSLPNMALWAPDNAVARKEMLWLLAYGAAVLIAGNFLGRALWGEAIGLHLHGAIYGSTRDVTQGEVFSWALYNFLFFAIIPYVVFRMRGYSNQTLGLRSSNLKNDLLVIVVILGLGLAIDLPISSLVTQSSGQLAAGIPLTIVIFLLGTGLPVMVFIYAILLPRYLKLSGSMTTTTIYGGLTYAALHIFESWTLYDSMSNGVLSVVFVFMQFFGPGMIKSYLTLRTGSAWVHLWGYHAIEPHVTFDTGHLIKIFKL